MWRHTSITGHEWTIKISNMYFWIMLNNYYHDKHRLKIKLRYPKRRLDKKILKTASKMTALWPLTPKTKHKWTITNFQQVYNGLLNETNKQRIRIKSTKNSLIRTYVLIYPLISRYETLKMLSDYSSQYILLPHTI